MTTPLSPVPTKTYVGATVPLIIRKNDNCGVSRLRSNHYNDDVESIDVVNNPEVESQLSRGEQTALACLGGKHAVTLARIARAEYPAPRPQVCERLSHA